MCRYIIKLLLMFSATGCEHLIIRTQNRVAVDGPVETQIRLINPVETRVTAELPPVNPSAGRVQPVTVQNGDQSIRVAIVDIDGLILNTPFVGPMSVGENPVSLFREKLDAIEADPCIRAVVLRVNSPGGGVAASLAMHHDLEQFKTRTGRPVVACLMDTATGGAYLVASAADQVIVSPATVTGGLGVILNLYNLKDLMLQFNIQPQSVKAGAWTDIGSSDRPLSDEEKQLLQDMADEFQHHLHVGIRNSRPTMDRQDKTTFDGRIFTGRQAVEHNLADRLGGLDDAIALAASLAGTSARPEVVLYRRSNDPAYTVYAVTPNVPLQGAGLLPNVPGLDRSKMPTFLSIWQPELTMEKLGGK